jgi:ElaB/YqjD/DUF883 family membrane-anchored ribosome-binding protein
MKTTADDANKTIIIARERVAQSLGTATNSLAKAEWQLTLGIGDVAESASSYLHDKPWKTVEIVSWRWTAVGTHSESERQFISIVMD